MAHPCCADGYAFHVLTQVTPSLLSRLSIRPPGTQCTLRGVILVNVRTRLIFCTPRSLWKCAKVKHPMKRRVVLLESNRYIPQHLFGPCMHCRLCKQSTNTGHGRQHERPGKARFKIATSQASQAPSIATQKCWSSLMEPTSAPAINSGNQWAPGRELKNSPVGWVLKCLHLIENRKLLVLWLRITFPTIIVEVENSAMEEELSLQNFLLPWLLEKEQE